LPRRAPAHIHDRRLFRDDGYDPADRDVPAGSGPTKPGFTRRHRCRTAGFVQMMPGRHFAEVAHFLLALVVLGCDPIALQRFHVQRENGEAVEESVKQISRGAYERILSVVDGVARRNRMVKEKDTTRRTETIEDSGKNVIEETFYAAEQTSLGLHIRYRMKRGKIELRITNIGSKIRPASELLEEEIRQAFRDELEGKFKLVEVERREFTGHFYLRRKTGTSA